MVEEDVTRGELVDDDGIVVFTPAVAMKEQRRPRYEGPERGPCPPPRQAFTLSSATSAGVQKGFGWRGPSNVPARLPQILPCGST